MPDFVCGKAGHKLGKAYGNSFELCAQSTSSSKILNLLSIFEHSLCTVYALSLVSFKQGFFGKFNLLLAKLYSFSTLPTNTTNLNI